MNIQNLTDEQLLVTTAYLARRERSITTSVLLHLKEIERRKLHLDRGFPSLHDYCVTELKYSEGSAHRRIQAMRLLRDIPSVEAKIADGSLNLTNAAKIQLALRDRPLKEKQEAVDRLTGKNGREVDRELAPEIKAKEGFRWVTKEIVELKVLLPKECLYSMEALKAIRSHQLRGNSFGKLVESLVELGHERWNPIRRAASPQRRNTAAQPSLNPRYLASSLRQEIWRRDQNQCTYTDPQTGLRCAAKHFLQIDHILPVALGGRAEAGNLRLLCAQHNQHRAAKTFGA